MDVGAAAEDRGSRRRGRFLLVTWRGGGNTPPFLALTRLLRERGHEVRLLAPRAFAEPAAAYGAELVPFPAALEWDDENGRALEDQVELCVETFAGPVLAELVRDAAPWADVVGCDCMLQGAMAGARAAGRPQAALVHVLYRPWASLKHPAGLWETLRRRGDETRAAFGIERLPRRYGFAALWGQPERALVLVAESFDGPGRAPTANVRYVGPLLDLDGADGGEPLPWADDDPRPLVLISLTSIYQRGTEDLLARILAAVDPQATRCLLTLGTSLRPDEIEAPPEVAVRRWVPHAAVMPRAQAVVTHAGLSTISTALAHGVPLLCLPLGADQPNNAARVEALGAGMALQSTAASAAIGAALTRLVADGRYRAGAERLAQTIAEYGQGARAVAELEGLLTSGPGHVSSSSPRPVGGAGAPMRLW